MNKTILLILLGTVLITGNVFAAGDLQVNGGLAVGTTPNTTVKFQAIGTNANGGVIKSLMNQDGVAPNNGAIGLNLQSDVGGTATGWGIGVLLTSQISSGASTIAGIVGSSFGTFLKGTATGTSTVAEISAGNFNIGISSGTNMNYTTTQGYGFHLGLKDERTSGNGTLHFTDFKNVAIDSPVSANAALSVENLAGIWVGRQSLGSVTNYGIVLDGDGSGSDLVFGANQEASIYASGGELFAKDGASNVTQISPHDPVTGEWRFYSKNVKTGRVVEVNMEKLVKAVEKLTGETFMIETVEAIK